MGEPLEPSPVQQGKSGIKPCTRDWTGCVRRVAHTHAGRGGAQRLPGLCRVRLPAVALPGREHPGGSLPFGWVAANRAKEYAATLEPLQEVHMPVYFVLFAAVVAFFAWALCDAAAHADDAMGER